MDQRHYKFYAYGRDDALVHWCMTRQIRARALALAGFEDEDD